MSTILRLTSFSLLALALALSTGCMVTPNTGKLLKNRNEKVEFSGFTRYPGETVTIWARNATTSEWEVLTTAKSGTAKQQMYGGDWYYWKKNHSIPAKYWNEPSPLFKASALVKSTLAGEDMYCFEEGFYEYFDDYDNVIDLWEEHGRGMLVWIASEE